MRWAQILAAMSGSLSPVALGQPTPSDRQVAPADRLPVTPERLRTSAADLLIQARDTVLTLAAKEGRLLAGSGLDERVQRLAGPVLRAAEALRPDWALTRWRIDLVATARPDGLNILVFGTQDLLLQWPARAGFDIPDPLLAALLAHGVAHGVRDHARESVRWPAATSSAGAQARPEATAEVRRALLEGPRFEVIAEREADRDTTELLARAGLDPHLAWTLRDTLAPSRSPFSGQHGRVSAADAARPSAWALTHPEPPQARAAIERFAARVGPLVGRVTSRP
jgi:hypothetical protein